MPRDRPAAGGQDSTLEGEFPSDLGGEGGAARVRPRKVSALYGNTYGESGFFVGGQNEAYQEVSYGYVFPYPILRIDDSPIGGDLSGVYQFSTPYILSYGSPAATTSTTGLAAGGTISSSTAVSFTGQHPGNFMLVVSAAPSGTGTLSGGELTFNFSVSNLTATEFGTYESPSPKLYNAQSVTSGQTFAFQKMFNLAPAYPLDDVRSNLLTAERAVVPNSDTTFNLNVSAILDAGATTGASINRANFTAYGITGFKTNYILSTLESSL